MSNATDEVKKEFSNLSNSNDKSIAFDTIMANVHNENLSDKEFREFISNTWSKKSSKD